MLILTYWIQAVNSEEGLINDCSKENLSRESLYSLRPILQTIMIDSAIKDLELNHNQEDFVLIDSGVNITSISNDTDDDITFTKEDLDPRLWSLVD